MTARPGMDLDNQLARLTLVLENAPVILYGLDREGRFLFSEGDGIAAAGCSWVKYWATPRSTCTATPGSRWGHPRRPQRAPQRLQSPHRPSAFRLQAHPCV